MYTYYFCNLCGAGISRSANLCVLCQAESQSLAQGEVDTWNPAKLRAKLKALRQERGWTQGELGDELGVNQSQISRLERGLSHFSPLVRLNAARLLELSPTEVGLTTTGDRLAPDVLRVFAAATTAAQELRTRGSVIAAADTLWPLLEVIGARTIDQELDPDVLLVQMNALVTNTQIVGDLAAHETRQLALANARRAHLLARLVGSARDTVRTSIQLGNQLRICGRPNEAIAELKSAYAIATTSLDRATAAERTARAAIDAGDRETYLIYLDHTLRESETSNGDALLNSTTVLELKRRAKAKFDHNQSDVLQDQPKTSSAAPQWNAIADITKAEALLIEGENDEGLRVMQEGIRAALNLHLARQVQRAEEIVRNRGGRQGADLASQLNEEVRLEITGSAASEEFA